MEETKESLLSSNMFYLFISPHLQMCACKVCLPLATRVQEMVRRGEILDDDMEDEFYLRRLDAGLFVLQLICYIMVEINNSGISQVHTFTDTPSLASRRTRGRFLF